MEPQEILTDQGREFQGEFQTFLSRHEITHRLESTEHPQSDGLAERMVQTMKRAVRKCLQDGGGAITQLRKQLRDCEACQ